MTINEIIIELEKLTAHASYEQETEIYKRVRNVFTIDEDEELKELLKTTDLTNKEVLDAYTESGRVVIEDLTLEVFKLAEPSEQVDIILQEAHDAKIQGSIFVFRPDTMNEEAELISIAERFKKYHSRAEVETNALF